MTPPSPAGPGRADRLVSVIVPAYNGARYLRECLDSLLRQTYGDLEILVADDASTDDTPAIIASCRDRVRGLRQPANGGILRECQLRDRACPRSIRGHLPRR